MKNLFARLLFAAVLGSLLTSIQSALAQGTAFTYQGQLTAGGGPASGSYDFTFALFNNSSTNSGQVGVTLTNLDLGVTNGLFTVTLDFGESFPGASRWLSIGVRTNGGGSFTALNPLQELTPTPYAIYTANAGSVAASNINGTLPPNDLPANVITNDASGVMINGIFTGSGSGLTNVPGTMVQVVTSGTNIAAQSNTSYDLTNAAQSLVTLPANANVGDVVQVIGTGAGGWAVTDYTPPVWTEQSNTPASAAWYAVAASFNGQTMAAAIEGGAIYLSTNGGVNWAEPAGSPNGPYWFSMASSADGTHLVAVAGGGGIIYVSTNSGVTWTQSPGLPGTAEWFSVASSADGTHLVAGSVNDGLYTSTNSGASWTQQTSGAPTSGWYSVASSADGTHLVAVIYEGGIYTSANSGSSWTEQAGAATSGEWFAVASSADGTHLAAALSPGGIYTSTNSGVTWVFSGAPNAQWLGVSSSADGTHLAGAVQGGGIYVSTNSGATWTQQTSAPTANWHCIALSGDASHLVAGVSGGGLYTEFESTITGAADTSEQFQYLGNGVWQPVPPPAGNGSGLTNVPGTIVQVVASGTNIAAQSNTSYDLTNAAQSLVTLPANANVGDVVQVTGTGAGGWAVTDYTPLAWMEQSNLPTSSPWYAVAASSNGQTLAAAIEGGAIYLSTNGGVNWAVPAGSPNSLWFSMASSADGTHLVAVSAGGGGTIFVSTNSGVTWTQSPGLPGAGQWFSVASSADGTHLLAGAENDGLYISTNSGSSWTQQINGVPTSGWYGVASSADGTHLVAVIYEGGIYTSANSGSSWTEQTSAPTSGEWFAVTSSADGTHLAAALSSSAIYTSANSGVTWVLSGAPNAQWLGVSSSADGTHLAGAAQGGGIYVSTNSGSTWTQQASAPTANWHCIALSGDASHLVAGVNGGGLYTEFESTITGAAQTSEQFQYVGNGVWQPLPTSGYISTNGSVVQVPSTLVTNGESGVTLSGTFTGVFSGNGSGLTSLTAANITSGGTLPALNGSNLTSLTAANIMSGGTLPTLNGANLTSLTAASIIPGGSLPNLNGANLTSLTAGNLIGTLPVISGANLMSLNAGSISSGTLADARLSSNVPLLNGTQTFTGGNTFNTSLIVNTGAGTLTIDNDQGVVPGIVANGGVASASGHARFRNALEIWPNTALTNGGYMDIRGTNNPNSPTISLTGNTGAIVSSSVTASGTITCASLNQTSDRNAKENFASVSAGEVLEKVAALPISQWNFKQQKDAKHIGPMAQDFHAAFGLDGADDKHISVIDEGGVALAAIQGLNKKLMEKDAEVQTLKQENISLQKRLEALEQAVQALAEKK
jgi:photosystem II stability/assembly factor-like uncharacterized protein